MTIREENKKLLELYAPLWRTRACGIARTARYLPFEGPAPVPRELRNDRANRKAKYLALGWEPERTVQP